jgi:response regulator of citrate/malate metabolism
LRRLFLLVRVVLDDEECLHEGDITLLNDSAQELLGLGPDAVGRRVDGVGLDPAAVPCSWCACRTSSRPSRLHMRDVLVVDDDFMVAEIHRRFVEQVDGFRAVGVARNGAEAVSAARELRPQLILLYVYLPDMTGLEVLRRLRADGDRVGVIMITAARELDTVSGALDGGAADYLIKPFEFDQLKAKLEAFATRADALESADGVDQSLIDSLFGGPGVASPKALLPKGLGAETGELVLAAVRDSGEVSAAECAEQVGISRVSARRYLEHYLNAGALEIRLQYGAGRPERRYRAAR